MWSPRFQLDRILSERFSSFKNAPLGELRFRPDRAKLEVGLKSNGSFVICHGGRTEGGLPVPIWFDFDVRHETSSGMPSPICDPTSSNKSTRKYSKNQSNTLPNKLSAFQNKGQRSVCFALALKRTFVVVNDDTAKHKNVEK